MRPLVVFGILLIAIGIAGLLIDNISFTEKRARKASGTSNTSSTSPS
jgi:hypothetical protein